jgi:hypothetical protein
MVKYSQVPDWQSHVLSKENNMKKPVLLLIAVLICGLILGCATPTTTPTSPSTTQVVAIDIGSPAAKNWDSDPEIDGIEFNLTPKDLPGKIVQTPGTVSAQLWLRAEFTPGITRYEAMKGELVHQWSGIKITKSDYTSSGARIRLEYGSFKPDYLKYGILEVTFETPDAKKFTVTVTSLILWG